MVSCSVFDFFAQNPSNFIATAMAVCASGTAVYCYAMAVYRLRRWLFVRSLCLRTAFCACGAGKHKHPRFGFCRRPRRQIAVTAEGRLQTAIAAGDKMPPGTGKRPTSQALIKRVTQDDRFRAIRAGRDNIHRYAGQGFDPSNVGQRFRRQFIMLSQANGTLLPTF